MSSVTVRRNINVEFISGGNRVNAIFVEMRKTIVSCGDSTILDTLSSVVMFLVSVTITVSVLIEAKIGRSTHSPQWSSFE